MDDITNVVRAERTKHPVRAAGGDGGTSPLPLTGNQYDLQGVPDLGTVIADADVGNAFETMTRFLFVRRLPVFVLIGQEMSESYKGNVSGRAGDMGYGENFEDLEGRCEGRHGHPNGGLAWVETNRAASKYRPFRV